MTAVNIARQGAWALCYQETSLSSLGQIILLAGSPFPPFSLLLLVPLVERDVPTMIMVKGSGFSGYNDRANAGLIVSA